MWQIHPKSKYIDDFYSWPKMKIEAFQVSHGTFRNCAVISLHIVVNIGNGVLWCVSVVDIVCCVH